MKVTVPATSANLGPGFDLLGLALPLYNRLEVVEAPSLAISHSGPEAAGLPEDATHLAYRAALMVAETLGRPAPAWRMAMDVQIPQSRGLGSSSAAIVAGLLAANAWFGEPLDREALLGLATRLEGHPDNVAPALYGGVTAAFELDGRARAISLASAPPCALVVCVPEITLSTEEARRALPQAYARADVVANLAAVTILTTVMSGGRIEWLPLGLNDRVHQPYRLPLIPGARSVLDRAVAAGAHGGVISGAGPTLLAFSPADRATEVAQAMETAWRQAGIGSRATVYETLAEGAAVHS